MIKTVNASSKNSPISTCYTSTSIPMSCQVTCSNSPHYKQAKKSSRTKLKLSEKINKDLMSGFNTANKGIQFATQHFKIQQKLTSTNEENAANYKFSIGSISPIDSPLNSSSDSKAASSLSYSATPLSSIKLSNGVQRIVIDSPPSSSSSVSSLSSLSPFTNKTTYPTQKLHVYEEMGERSDRHVDSIQNNSISILQQTGIDGKPTWKERIKMSNYIIFIHKNSLLKKRIFWSVIPREPIPEPRTRYETLKKSKFFI